MSTSRCGGNAIMASNKGVCGHGSCYGAVHLWCRSLRGHLLCAKSIKTKIGRLNLPRFHIPLAKMLQLMGGIDPQDRFLLNTKLMEFFFLRVPNWPH